MLFGADKIPEIARGLGKMMREVKDASNEIKREIKDTSKEIKDNIDKEING
jgi:sec-independent protein translocase protein TatA|tara:strand:- start:363 stop:515 length:153 start_codon:yes stop_codon:yes gene_type:complete